MARKFTILIILLFLEIATYAQNPIWSRGNAFTVPYRKAELNLMSPSKYGISRKAEISAHPIAFFVMPHFFYKRKWFKTLFFNRTLMVSSRHGLFYPTGALNFTQKLGLDFLLLQSSAIPYSIAMQHEILLSSFLDQPSNCNAGNNLLTAKFGFKYAYNWGESSPPLIERAILFRETSLTNNELIWYTGARIDAYLNPMFNYFAEVDFYSHGLFKNISIEAKAGVMGYSGKRLSAFGGIKAAYSTIPSGNKFLIIPIFDISYNFKVGKIQVFIWYDRKKREITRLLYKTSSK